MTETATVPVGRFIAIVDMADLPLVSKYKWYPHRNIAPDNDTTYALAKDSTKASRKTILMHRLILNAPVGLEVDHKNRNRLDNRRENLRYATRSQQMANKIVVPGKSGFRGVYKLNRGLKRYLACVIVNCQRIRAPSRWSAEEAARDYDAIALRNFGEYARLNFPEVSHET